MTQYNSANAKLSNLQPNKIKSGIKNVAEVALIFHQTWLVILIFHIEYY